MFSQKFSLAIARLQTITKSFSTSASNTITNQVNPYSNLKIATQFHLNIKPYDLFDCPDGNLLRISLQPIKPEISPKLTKVIEKFSAFVQIDDRNVVINTKDSHAKDLIESELYNGIECLIEVPVKANLNIIAERNVSIENLYSDEIFATAEGDIKTKNIQSVGLNLTSHNGNIRCEGNTLAHQIDIRANGNKNIHLNKVLGDTLNAICDNGCISTESCYSENSKFISTNGSLNLKNVHKTAEIFLLNGGNLNVTGFHGILRAKTDGGKLNFQLTEIYEDSSIEANNPTEFNVNISEFVEEHTCLSIAVKELSLDSKLVHLTENIVDGSRLELGNTDLVNDSLTIQSNGKLNLGKLSWMDTVKLKFPIAAEQTIVK